MMFLYKIESWGVKKKKKYKKELEKKKPLSIALICRTQLNE